MSSHARIATFIQYAGTAYEGGVECLLVCLHIYNTSSNNIEFSLQVAKVLMVLVAVGLLVSAPVHVQITRIKESDWNQFTA